MLQILQTTNINKLGISFILNNRRWYIFLALLLLSFSTCVYSGDDHGSLQYRGYTFPYGSASGAGFQSKVYSVVSDELVAASFYSALSNPFKAPEERSGLGILYVTFNKSEDLIDKVEANIIQLNNVTKEQTTHHPLKNWKIVEKADYVVRAQEGFLEVKGRKILFRHDYVDGFRSIKNILSIYLFPDRKSNGTLIIEESGQEGHSHIGFLFKRMYVRP
jgi:hypothetical protein